MLDQHRRPASPEGFVIGLMIMLFGFSLFLDRMGIVEWRGWQLGPFVLIGLGLIKLLKPRSSGHRHGGFLVFLGVWLLFNQLNLLRFRDSWPLILVALGTSMAWKALSASPSRRIDESRHRSIREDEPPPPPSDIAPAATSEVSACGLSSGVGPRALNEEQREQGWGPREPQKKD